ncbi:MAG: CHAD domain-containing protein [Fimbriimonadales bacterium]
MNGNRPIGDLAYELLGEFRRQFESYRDSAYGGEDPEAIHQMRVNGRRLRACMRAFKPVLAQPVLELDSELQWIAVSLGEVRDVDVQLESMPDLAEALRDIRLARLVQMRHDLDSRRCLNLAEALRCRIEVAAHDDPALASAPALAVAPDVVGRAYRAVRRIASEIDPSSDADAIHTLRKRAKRLRYTVDCFAGLYGKPGKRFVAGLKDLQDLLGAHQDAIVAQNFCAELKGRGFDDRLEQYAEDAHEAATELRAKLPDALAGLATRWRPLKERMKLERRGLWRAANASE